MKKYQLYFKEANAPYPSDCLTHNVLISVNDDCFDMEVFEDELKEIKEQMDYFDEEDADNPLYEKYGDYGWDERIEASIKIVSKAHPEWKLKIINSETYTIEIN